MGGGLENLENLEILQSQKGTEGMILFVKGLGLFFFFQIRSTDVNNNNLKRYFIIKRNK